MRARDLVILAPLGCLTLGCSSSYRPVANQHVAIVVDGLSYTGLKYSYYRDGKKYEGSWLGGEIEEAVHGNARAEDYAREYRTGMTAGLLLDIAGIGMALGGAAVFAADASHSSTATPGQTSSGVPLTGFYIAIAGLVVDLIGSAVSINAVTHLFDAVNAYNDGATSTKEDE
jgi:hypothetical protein